MGDIIFSATVLQFIHKHYPFAKITWVCDDLFAPLFTEHPLLHHVHGVRLKQLKKERSVSLLKAEIKALRALGTFEMIIDLQSLLKSALIGKILRGPLFGFSKVGCREPLAAYFYTKTFDIPYEENVVMRALRLTAQSLQFDFTSQEIAAKSPLFFTDTLPNRYDASIAIVIGASWPSKRYPNEQWVRCINMLNRPVYIVYGNESEKEDALSICHATPLAKPAPPCALFELLTFINTMQLIIGNDTGPTHMAWALNKASITLFGPTNERMIYPTEKNWFINSDSPVDILHINKADESIATIEPSLIAKRANELLHLIEQP